MVIVMFVADGLSKIISGLTTPLLSEKMYSDWEKLTTIAVQIHLLKTNLIDLSTYHHRQ